jgi:hypothetical protein
MKSERKELKGICWVNTNNMGNSLLPKQCYLSRYSYRANFWNNGLLKKGNRASPLLVCFKYAFNFIRSGTASNSPARRIAQCHDVYGTCRIIDGEINSYQSVKQKSLFGLRKDFRVVQKLGVRVQMNGLRSPAKSELFAELFDSPELLLLQSSSSS